MKQLDLKDIESLGWKPSPDEPEEWFWALNGDMDIQLYYNTKIDMGIGVGITIYDLSGQIFDGWLHTKEDLKRLMYQLGFNKYE